MTTASIASTNYQVSLKDGRHAFIADEPIDKGGKDTGPAPDELLEAALASCTAITLRMYSDRKNWKVDGIDVAVNLERTDGQSIFTRKITISGEIDETQRERLLQIAKLCPVSKTLSGANEVDSYIV